MLVSRKELLIALGAPLSFGPGQSHQFETEDGAMRAWIGWNDDDQFEANISSPVFGDSGEALLGLEGEYIPGDDGFVLKSFDHRSEASAPDDPLTVAASFRSLLQVMQAAAA